jgi:hypothetical protein
MNETAGSNSSFELALKPLLVILTSWILFCGSAAALYTSSRDVWAVACFACLAVAGLVLARIVWAPPRALSLVLQSRLSDFTSAIDSIPSKRLGIWIALAAGLGLYLELAIIRFHASCFQIFAFFKNFSLLSCFLGLGAGYLLKRRRPMYLPLFVPLLGAQVIFLQILRYTIIGESLHNPIPEYATLGLSNILDLTSAVMVYALLVWEFSYNSICFM